MMQWTRRVLLVVTCLALSLAARPAFADAEHEGSFWPGYMSSWWFDPSWSVWFDTHYNTDSFYMVRGGLTHVFDTGISATGGYAFLLLNPDFERYEHRAWGQTFYPHRFNDKWSLSGRLRLDFRFLESLEDGEIVDGFDFVFRTRVAATLTRRFDPIRFGRPMMQLGYEILLNAAADPDRATVDQSRVSFLVGIETKHVTVRVGYMNRYLPNSRDDGLVDHAVLVWLTQSVDLTKRLRPQKEELYEDFPEYGGD